MVSEPAIRALLEAFGRDYRVYSLAELKLESCDASAVIGVLRAFYEDEQIIITAGQELLANGGCRSARKAMAKFETVRKIKAYRGPREFFDDIADQTGDLASTSPRVRQ